MNGLSLRQERRLSLKAGKITLRKPGAICSIQGKQQEPTVSRLMNIGQCLGRRAGSQPISSSECLRSENGRVLGGLPWQDAFRTAGPTCERYLRVHLMDTRLPMWFVCWEALGTKIALSNIKKIP